MLWRLIREKTQDDTDNFSRGLALGALGGTIGFFTSGLVHYNWGDSEVVTVFYFIMGLCLVVERTNQQIADSSVRV
jgi:predicted permease